MGLDDQSEQAQADQPRRAQSVQGRLGHRPDTRSGGPATNRASVAAIDSVSGTSIVRINSLGVGFRVSEKGAGSHETRKPDCEEHCRPSGQQEPQPAPADRRCVNQPGHCSEYPHGGEDRSTLKLAARSNRPNPENVDPDKNPDRHQESVR